MDARDPLVTLASNVKQHLRTLERDCDELFYALDLPGGFDADQGGFRLFCIPTNVGSKRRQSRSPEVKL